MNKNYFEGFSLRYYISLSNNLDSLEVLWSKSNRHKFKYKVLKRCALMPDGNANFNTQLRIFAEGQYTCEKSLTWFEP